MIRSSAFNACPSPTRTPLMTRTPLSPKNTYRSLLTGKLSLKISSTDVKPIIPAEKHTERSGCTRTKEKAAEISFYVTLSRASKQLQEVHSRNQFMFVGDLVSLTQTLVKARTKLWKVGMGHLYTNVSSRKNHQVPDAEEVWINTVAHTLYSMNRMKEILGDAKENSRISFHELVKVDYKGLVGLLIYQKQILKKVAFKKSGDLVSYANLWARIKERETFLMKQSDDRRQKVAGVYA